MNGKTRQTPASTWALVIVGTLALGSPDRASAQADGEALETLADLQGACQEATRTGPRRLYAMVFPAGGFRFGAYDESSEMLPVDTRRNLRAFAGAAELFPTHREPLGFRGSEDRARQLRARAEGASLRVGFFLGFDNPNRTLCLLRPAAGVTTVRMDLGFVELVDGDGSVFAREDTERLRAWQDDEELDGVPGEGPRGEARPPLLTALGRRAPRAWVAAFQRANRGALGRALSRCHAAGTEQSGQVVVRLRVDPNSGRVVGRRVELSTLRDERESRCIAEAVAGVALPAQSGLDRARDGTVSISVPVALRR